MHRIYCAAYETSQGSQFSRLAAIADLLIILGKDIFDLSSMLQFGHDYSSVAASGLVRCLLEKLPNEWKPGYDSERPQQFGESGSSENDKQQVERLREPKVCYLEKGALAADGSSPTLAFFQASISRSSSGPDQITVPSSSMMNAIRRVMVSLSRAALFKALLLFGCRSERTTKLSTDAEGSSTSSA